MERLLVLIKLAVLALSLIAVFGASFFGTLAMLAARDLFAYTLLGGCVTVMLGSTSLFVVVWRSLRQRSAVIGGP
jgi:hypothetical protein